MSHHQIESKKLSTDFHGAIGEGGLSSLSKKSWDRAILKQVESLLRKDQKILDVGCGYGRIALPLLKKGYDVYGMDLSKKYITALRRELTSGKARQRFKVADMCDLPFDNDTFDVVLCLWSVFDELLFIKDQVSALREMHRVLREGGFAVIECHQFMVPAPDDVRNGNLLGHKKRIRRDYVAGATYYHYNHDYESLNRVLIRSGIRNFTVAEEWFGWRERVLIRFGKSSRAR